MSNYSGIYEVIPGLHESGRKTYRNANGLYLHFHSKVDDLKMNESVPGAWVGSLLANHTDYSPNKKYYITV
eukprot:5831392-Amphidinium_carterae.1